MTLEFVLNKYLLPPLDVHHLPWLRAIVMNSFLQLSYLVYYYAFCLKRRKKPLIAMVNKIKKLARATLYLMFESTGNYYTTCLISVSFFAFYADFFTEDTKPCETLG